MSVLQEFKDFAMKGNVIDMAVGIIIGAAFGGIVSSLVSDIIMPPIGYLLGGVDFADLKIVLKDSAVPAEMVAIKYGLFLNKVINFVVVAWSMFLVIRVMNKLNKGFIAAKK